jgi:hypothetical protein
MHARLTGGWSLPAPANLAFGAMSARENICEEAVVYYTRKVASTEEG